MAAGAAAGALLVTLLPVAADADEVEETIEDVNRAVPASASLEASATVRFVALTDGTYAAVLDRDGGDDGSLVSVVAGLVKSVGPICLPGESDCEETSPYLDCEVELSLAWGYERSGSPLSTDQWNNGFAELVCLFEDTGAGALPTSWILDNGVTGPLGGPKWVLCPEPGTTQEVANHPSVACDPDLSRDDPLETNREYFAKAWQNVLVVKTDTSGEVPVPEEVHGVGSVYEFETQFAIDVPELFDEVVYFCAVGSVLDPRSRIDLHEWDERPCDFGEPLGNTLPLQQCSGARPDHGPGGAPGRRGP